jgi:hypothetical protein
MGSFVATEVSKGYAQAQEVPKGYVQSVVVKHYTFLPIYHHTNIFRFTFSSLLFDWKINILRQSVLAIIFIILPTISIAILLDFYSMMWKRVIYILYQIYSCIQFQWVERAVFSHMFLVNPPLFHIANRFEKKNLPCFFYLMSWYLNLPRWTHFGSCVVPWEVGQCDGQADFKIICAYEAD